MRRLRITAFLFLFSLVVPLATPSLGFAAPPTQKALSIALIGDSYSAGNGAGDYFGPDGSFRSKNNWAEHYASWLLEKDVSALVQNGARSGAVTKDIVDQATKISSATDLVMLTAGGNDVKFADIVSQCFAIGYRDARGCRQKVDYAKDNLDQAMAGTRKVFEAVEKRGLRPGAQIVLVGYPLLSEDRDYVLQNCYSSPFGICTTFERYEAAQKVRALGLLANSKQDALVKAWNAGHSLKVTYISGISSHFATHEPDPRAKNKNDYRWINEFFETEGRKGSDGKTKSLGTRDQNHFYHPNIIGHSEIARTIEAQIGVPSAARAIGSGTAENIDIAFVVDTTGSMGDDIDAVRRNIGAIVDGVAAKSASARFSLVTFKDFPSAGGDATDYPSQLEVDFTSEGSSLKTALDRLVASGGGDGPESVYSGVMRSLNLGWRDGARKVAIVLGDAPAKDPEPVTGYTAASVAKLAYEIDPVEVDGIDTGSLASGGFSDLVDASGGKIYSTSEADIPEKITAAVTAALNKPFAWIRGPYVAKVGAALEVDAQASYGITSKIVKYEWDFDGDGTYERVTTSGVTSHIFSTVFDGVIGVRVTDGDGVSNAATTTASITDDGDTVPRAKDNCPDVANHGQSDFDHDGIGDECDPTPGYPTNDKPGVSEVTSKTPLPTPSPTPSPTSSPTTSVSQTPTSSPTSSTSPSPTPSPTSSVSPSGQTTPPSVSTTANVVSMPVKNDAHPQGGSLASTGASGVPKMLAIAGTFIVLGSALLVASRRRHAGRGKS